MTLKNVSKSLLREIDLIAYYPKPVSINASVIKNIYLSMTIRNFNVPIFKTLGYLDPFILDDLDALLLANVDSSL